jgi:hypothetical protein
LGLRGLACQWWLDRLGGCHTARDFKAASIRTLLIEVGAYVVECRVEVVKAEKE